MYLLLRRRQLPIITLARRYKVNERTIQRDLKLLRESDAPIEKGVLGFYVDKRKD